MHKRLEKVEIADVIRNALCVVGNDGIAFRVRLDDLFEAGQTMESKERDGDAFGFVALTTDTHGAIEVTTEGMAGMLAAVRLHYSGAK